MNEVELLVIGHRNPDTDAICSAIGYAEFKRRTGAPQAVAARCGDTNARIDFVLETFGVPAPRFIADVSPKVEDVTQRNVISISPEAPMIDALGLMDERSIRVLPVLDAERHCLGLVSVFKMGKFFCPTPHQLVNSRRVLASLDSLARVLDAELIHGIRPGEEQEFLLVIGAMRLESFAARLANYPPEKLLVVMGDRPDIQRAAIRGRARALIVTGGMAMDPEIVAEARRQGVSMLLSPHDTTTTAMLCRAAIAVRHMVHEEFLTFRADEPLAEARPVATASNFQAFPVLDEQQRVVGILTKSDFLKKVRRQLILVDHNELSQAVPGADQVEIIEIIDHHRIGSLTTRQPILFRNEPVGSTSTIVADSFFRNQVELPKPIAGVLLAGIVADTLNLTSPTSTEKDASILKKLETLSGVSADTFTEKLFSSGSVLISLPPDQAIVADNKEFHERGRDFSVAQIEELGFGQFWKHKSQVMDALENFRKETGHYFSGLLVTDVAQKTSLLVISGPSGFLKQIDYPMLEPGIYELPGIVSRKKELLPYLLHCLEKGAG